MPTTERASDIRGLCSDEAAERLALYGPNELAPRKAGDGIFVWVKRLLMDPMVVLLVAASGTYWLLGDRADAIVTAVALAPIFLVTAVLEERADRALEALRKLTSPKVRVLRDGTAVTIPAAELVPGDVMFVQEGDVFAADGELLDGRNLSVDESALTGESQPVTKTYDSERTQRRVLAGTTLLAGRGAVAVRETGARTEYGRIGALMAQMPVARTPIEKTITRVVTQVGIAVLFVCVAVIAIERFHGETLPLAVIAGVSLAMAALPEELPMVYTLYLALGAWRLAKDNALVRRLASVETLGSTSVICVDKTGTLTFGRLDLIDVILAPDVSGTELLKAALLASQEEPFDPLEQAIVKRAQSDGLKVADLYRLPLVADFPFEPQLRRTSRAWKSGDGYYLTAKGAPEVILARSSLDDDERAKLVASVERLAAGGARVIAVASRNYAANLRQRDELERDLQFLGLLAFADVVRPDVAKNLQQCRTAGIRVIMITGDHPATALAVARAIGFETSGGVITGEQLASMSQSALAQTLETTTIFARTRPEQKLQIVKALHERKRIVAMTGDGTNDALALREADIGIALGQRGTEVARSAADLVLLDDDFSTIVNAVRDGRRIFENLRKAFRYLQGFHAPLLLSALLIPLIGAPLFLLPVHLVWLEIIVHPTSALIYENEPAPPDLMRRPPRAASSGLLQIGDWIRPLSIGIVLSAAVIVLYVWSLSHGETTEVARSLAIVAMFAGQSILVLTERTPEAPVWRADWRKNKMISPILAATLATLALALYVPPIAHVMKMAPLAWSQVGLAIGVAALSSLWLEPFKRGAQTS
jgi:Ca2+-transporting ATPase